MALTILLGEKQPEPQVDTWLQGTGHQLVRASDYASLKQQAQQSKAHIIFVDDSLLLANTKEEKMQQLAALVSDEAVPPTVFLLTEKAESYPSDTPVLYKPYNKSAFLTSIQLVEKMYGLQQTMRKQQHKLGTYQRYLSHEKAVASEILATVSRSGCLDDPQIHYRLPPLALFNGDLLLAARRPSGDLNIMFGEFSGQVLPAAVSALPLAEIFYSMTSRGYSSVQILIDLNRRIKSIFHYGVFFAACFVEIDTQKGVLNVWNGGMPNSYLCHADGKIKAVLASHYLPLGMIEDSELAQQIQVESIQNGERIFLFSQNIINLANSHNKLFGKERLESLLNNAAKDENLFEAILAQAKQHAGNMPDVENITLAEVIISEPAFALALPQRSGSHYINQPRSENWHIMFELQPDSLRSLDPLPVILHILMECADLQPHKTAIYTIIAELYSNALEHGILGLDSQLKKTPEGFLAYYQKRSESLAALKEGFVRFNIHHRAEKGSGKLVIEIEDSGPGFDYQGFMHKNFKKSGYSGRGVPLIQSLCADVSYHGKGNQVRAIYSWDEVSAKTEPKA